jgi:hypothetical protein
MSTPNTSTPSAKQLPDADWLETVRSHVNSLKFGVVQIVVHDSVVVQIERTEKVRFGKLKPEAR